MPEVNEASEALILIASLPDEVGRRQGVRANFEGRNIPFAILDSVDGRGWSDEEVSSHVSEELNALRLRIQNRGGIWLASGAIACAITHRDLLLGNVAAPGRIVCEDDILFQPEFLDSLEDSTALKALSALDDGVVLLNYRAHGRHLVAEKTPVARFGSYSIHKSIGHVASGAAYFATPEVAQRIRCHQTPVRDSADSWNAMKDAGAIDEIYLVHPMPVGTGMFPASINYYQGRRRIGVLAYLQRNTWLRWLRWRWLMAKGKFTERVTDWR
jgi:hypothetical protein